MSTEVKELGSEREMAHIERIIREGTGADRQLGAWEDAQDMKAVVDHIVAETVQGFNGRIAADRRDKVPHVLLATRPMVPIRKQLARLNLPG